MHGLPKRRTSAAGCRQEAACNGSTQEMPSDAVKGLKPPPLLEWREEAARLDRARETGQRLVAELRQRAVGRDGARRRSTGGS